MATKKKDATDELADVAFETALEELESLVKKMETGELSLEDSLAAFERGVKLTRHCQSSLKAAELKVKVLTESGDLEELDIDSLDDA
ncbi:MAG: exodeoxyribonuclease VII small subunit [Gammaproteobacteria bacterium]|nr:MAG: exodeoxyribonuclease VII small subunit [Gammaproteobacteria bacterium]